MLKEQAASTTQRFRSEDPSLKTFFDTAYGYVVFPTVAKGAIGVGGAHGANADFDRGVAVFTLPRAGLMFEASIGGQKFSYRAGR